MENWIEREMRRNKVLMSGAETLWQEVCTAIDNVCQSFNHHYPNAGSARLVPTNGHTILIEITHEKNKEAAGDMKRRVRIAFYGDSISVTVDEHKARKVEVDADLDHCFLKTRNGEISIDQFTENALKDALFTPRNPAVSGSPPPKLGVWA